jgi:16S rRNA (cytosine1402-N4)-methyltransferase
MRIEVNEELEILRPALERAMALLAPGGRCVVLAYHSGEDRIVKSAMRDAATGGCTCPPGLPCGCGAVPTVRLLKRGSWRPSADEIAGNRRSESARLRAVEKLPVAA